MSTAAAAANTTTPQAYSREVRNQYEELPYPPRNPEDEKTRMLYCLFDSLILINHYCYGGKRDLTTSKAILVAGCGTGDAVIYLGEQYREYSDTTITALDMSAASLNICKERAAIRNLNNINFIHASLYDIPDLDLGNFDYINCSGVLHHLDNPDRGLSILANCLNEDGVIMVMVYGQIGRTAIYNTQAMMKHIFADTVTDPEQKVALCSALIDTIPPTNWLQMNKAGFMEDIKKLGASGIYDLFLHFQDRAYTIPQLYEWVERASLNLHTLLCENTSGHYRYDPLRSIDNKTLHEVIEALPMREQQAIAELMYSNIVKHSFYGTKFTTPSAEFAEDMVPLFFSQALQARMQARLLEHITQCPTGKTLRIPFSNEFVMQIPCHSHTTALFSAIDQKRSVRAIIDYVIEHERLEKTTQNKDMLYLQLRDLYKGLHEHHFMLLQHESTPTMPDVSRLQKKSLA